MQDMLMLSLGAAAGAVLAWYARQEFLAGRSGVPSHWAQTVQEIEQLQNLELHREARAEMVQACRRLQRCREKVVAFAQARFASLLLRDPIYPMVLQEIRAACVADRAVSELALCLRLRDYALEDIRQCMDLAEAFGQIYRQKAMGCEPMVMASYHATA